MTNAYDPTTDPDLRRYVEVHRDGLRRSLDEGDSTLDGERADYARGLAEHVEAGDAFRAEAYRRLLAAIDAGEFDGRGAA